MGKELGRVPNDDLEKIKQKRNPPEYEPGYEPMEDTPINFDSFNDINMGGLGGNDNMGGNPFGPPDDHSLFGGGPMDGFNPLGGLPGMDGLPGMGQPPPPAKPDTFDLVSEKVMVAASAFSRVFTDTLKSFKNRTAQEVGVYGKNLLYTGLCTMVGSQVLGFLGFIGGIPFLAFYGLPATLFLTGLTLLGCGILALTIPAYLISKGYIKGDNRKFKDVIEDIDLQGGFQSSDVDDPFGISASWDETMEGGDETYFADEIEEEPEMEETDLTYDLDALFSATPQNTNPADSLDRVQANVPIISRSYLVETFKNFFPTNTLGFADKKEIEEGSAEFESLEGIIIKALMAVTRTDIDSFDVDKYHMIDAFETLFTYEIRFIRYKGQKNLDEIANEVVAYYMGYTGNMNVSAQVTIVADFYKIVIFKGVQAVVTLGDILQLPETLKFFKDERNKLPMCVGIQPDGSPMLRDAKIFDSMLIAGKPRSGKSWYTLNLLINLIAFNTPEDIQIIIVDPKNSALMNTLALMPHVCGFHKNDYILRLLDDLINNEGQRREKLLLDHKCDDIWTLREKTGIKLPILYLFIDEYMTVVNSLEKDDQKELQSKLNILISQLPSKGIRLIFVPHRAQGVVDKTTRTMISFSCAIKATSEVVKETLDIPKFETVLTNPGDTAVMMVGENKAHYVKGNAITINDSENKDLIMAMAKAFYKMGVDVPDMSCMRLAANRDEDKVREELFGEGTPKFLKK